jgi:hypothetical protein
LRAIPVGRRDPSTAQTPGTDRGSASTSMRVGARKPWAGTVHVHPARSPERNDPVGRAA